MFNELRLQTVVNKFTSHDVSHFCPFAKQEGGPLWSILIQNK